MCDREAVIKIALHPPFSGVRNRLGAKTKLLNTEADRGTGKGRAK